MKLWELCLTAIALSVLVVVLVSSKISLVVSAPQKPLDFSNLTSTYDKSEKLAYFNNKQISVPSYITAKKDNAYVLGEQKTFGDMVSEKRIYVDLTNQRLYAYEGDKLVYNFLVSTGKWNRTPTGKFRIWIKLRYTKMEGGSKTNNTYYYLPNVPYTMFFYNRDYPKWLGYGIHGTYWHDNFGHPMSHGCINMKTEEAEQLYYWAMPNLNGKSSIQVSKDNPGTEVIIFGKAPQE
ncbi:MAG: L,D-transpeptidase [Patescibacteria group bacterium]|jgi:lipoprotein-anchoring transpeptidase ErfK/SrfK